MTLKRIGITIAVFALLLYFWNMIFHQVKPVPDGVHTAGDVRMIAEEDVTFLRDLTYQEDGERVLDHELFDEMYDVIREAEEFLVIDMFMINDFSSEGEDYPPLSREFTDVILERMEERPELDVHFISDPVNTTYFSHEAEQLERLREAGAEITFTDLTLLRDPNPLYSSFWRFALEPFGQEGTGWLPNAFGPESPDVTIRSYLKLANIKANHRKTVTSEKASVISSANPHDASGWNSNAGVRVEGPLIQDILETEKAAAAFSGADTSQFPAWSGEEDGRDRPIQAQVVTERYIETAALKTMEAMEEGDELWIGMFYLSDRHIIEKIEETADRGVDVKLILDPNQNAFGQDKIGLPNIPVAAELLERGDDRIQVRWYNTEEEQYHTKMMAADRGDTVNVLIGSSNFTARNLDNYNLETNISFTSPPDTAFAEDVLQYMEETWNNDGQEYTTDYDTHAEAIAPGKYFLYLLQKALGFTTY
ncbi:phospholipase D family protein [Alkalicoccus urumqiensis]|nr:phospholipase D family protein [Alkalicoccus urumqiensis]